jgi:WD40 repeat protein
LKFLSESQRLILACPDGSLLVWDWTIKELLFKDFLETNDYKKLYFKKIDYSAPNDLLIFTANESERLYLIKLDALINEKESIPQNMKKIELRQKAFINTFTIHPNSSTKLVSLGCSDGNIQNYNFVDEKWVSTMCDIINKKKIIGILNLAYSFDGDLLISADTDGYVNIWKGTELEKNQNLLISKKITDVYFLDLSFVKNDCHRDVEVLMI